MHRQIQVKPHFLRGLCALLLAGFGPATAWAWAWADDGHQVTGLIAERLLTPATKAAVNALLAGDDTGLVNGTDLAIQTTWADKYRESDRRGERTRYEATSEWHFVDMQIDAPDMPSACYGFPVLAAGTPASAGVAKDCIVGKLEQFIAELRAPVTSEAERRRALQFVLHLVGDIHQPLHAADNHDRGGNDKWIVSPAPRRADLHYYWDTWYVRQLGGTPADIAALLSSRLSAAQQRALASGTPREWALETFAIGRERVYGALPAPQADGNYVLPFSVTSTATDLAAQQLLRAGVRLAMVLNAAFDPPR